MSRLIVVSNRVPPPSGANASTGGLAIAVLAALKESGGIWFGWNGEISAETAPDPHIVKSGNISYATIPLKSRDLEEYYNGYSNQTLWPLFHYRPGLFSFSRRDFKGYLRVNTLFAKTLAPLLREKDEIWVHDYHLIPLAERLRGEGVSQPIGFFLHIPLPPRDLLITLPNHDALIRSLCAYDLVGFQTDNDLWSFYDYILREAGGEIDDDGVVHAYGRTFIARAFPIGIDTQAIARQAQKAAISQTTKRLQDSLGGRNLIIGVDRLDYSKGLARRFEAYNHLLENHKNHRNHVIFMQIAPPSRSQVPEYTIIRKELETMAGHINGRFAEYDWGPIRYLNKGFNHTTLTGFFRAALVGLVTPMRDGMNLVAKEYVAAQNPNDPGVLVLSRFAGAARELDAALIVNPSDPEGVAETLNRALSLSLEERRERWNDMMDCLKRNDISFWRSEFLKALKESRKRQRDLKFETAALKKGRKRLAQTR